MHLLILFVTNVCSYQAGSKVPRVRTRGFLKLRA
jgi:hypothetical protein